MYHLAEDHTNVGTDNTLPKIPGELLVDAYITSAEEGWMGIDEELTRDFREENQIPDTDGVEEL
jgi:hypothetical protein